MGEPTKSTKRPQKSRGRLSRFLIGSFLIFSTLIVLLFSGFLTAQAMYGTSASDVSEFVVAMLSEEGALPTATITLTPTNTPPIVPSPPAEVVPDQRRKVIVVTRDPRDNSPTPTPSSTETPTPTLTGTSTETPTITSSPTHTPTRWMTWTPSRTPWPTWTVGWRSPTRTNTPTEPPPPTSTSPPTLTSTPPTPGVPSPTRPTATRTNTSVPTATPTEITTACNTTTHTSYESQIVSLINAERQSRGLHALSVQSQLRAAARVHGADMACNGFHSHTGSDGSSVRDRVRRQGYTFSWIGENYMVTPNSSSAPNSAFDWWMNSTPHRNNILSPHYTEFGVGGISSDVDWGIHFVIVFARP